MASTEAVSPLLGVPTRPGRGTCWRGASTGSDLADRAGRLSGRSHFLRLCGDAVFPEQGFTGGAFTAIVARG